MPRNITDQDEQDFEPIGARTEEGDNEEEFYEGNDDADPNAIGRADGVHARPDYGLPEEATRFEGRDDSEIKADLAAVLRQRADIDDTRISMEVRSGEVTLSGTATRQTRRMAEKLAEGITGVRSVKNNIQEAVQ